MNKTEDMSAMNTCTSTQPHLMDLVEVSIFDISKTEKGNAHQSCRMVELYFPSNEPYSNPDGRTQRYRGKSAAFSGLAVGPVLGQLSRGVM